MAISYTCKHFNDIYKTGAIKLTYITYISLYELSCIFDFPVHLLITDFSVKH